MIKKTSSNQLCDRDSECKMVGSIIQAEEQICHFLGYLSIFCEKSNCFQNNGVRKSN